MEGMRGNKYSYYQMPICAEFGCMDRVHPCIPCAGIYRGDGN